MSGAVANDSALSSVRRVRSGCSPEFGSDSLNWILEGAIMRQCPKSCKYATCTSCSHCSKSNVRDTFKLACLDPEEIRNALLRHYRDFHLRRVVPGGNG